MKIRIDWDEEYPVYAIDNENGVTEVEVPDGFDKKFKRAAKQWDDVQRTLREAYEAARNA